MAPNNKIAKKPEAITKISSGGGSVKKTQQKPKRYLWVIKLQCLPFGFFEKELLGYFRQFGTVIRVRVARSRSTGNHKGWAYVGFDNKDVAEIAAETMNGYLMFEHRLIVKVMKPEKIPKSMKTGPLLVTRPSYKGNAKKDAIARNSGKGKDEKVLLMNRQASLKKTMRGLEQMGVDYKFGLKPADVKPVIGKENEIEVLPTPPKKSGLPTPKKAPQTPKVVAKTPKKAVPEPKVATPQTPKVVEAVKTPTPKNTPQPKPSPKVVETAKTPKRVAIQTPKKTPTQKVIQEAKTPKFSPKTRAQKAGANTPAPQSALSKTIKKSVAASARPAPIEKASLRGKKKKSM